MEEVDDDFKCVAYKLCLLFRIRLDEREKKLTELLAIESE